MDIGQHQRTITLSDLSAKQPLVGIPMDLIRANPKGAEVEYDQPDVDVLVLRLVARRTDNTSSFNKRYAVVRHHGTHWTSIPKLWLKDRGAKAGDRLEISRHPTLPALILQLVRTET